MSCRVMSRPAGVPKYLYVYLGFFTEIHLHCAEVYQVVGAGGKGGGVLPRNSLEISQVLGLLKVREGQARAPGGDAKWGGGGRGQTDVTWVSRVCAIWGGVPPPPLITPGRHAPVTPPPHGAHTAHVVGQGVFKMAAACRRPDPFSKRFVAGARGQCACHRGDH